MAEHRKATIPHANSSLNMESIKNALTWVALVLGNGILWTIMIGLYMTGKIG